jgi:hypothetical protein
MREAGCTAVQEVAFTLAHGLAYVGAAVKAGLDVDRFAGRLSFFFAAHNDLFEEVAKFRAARRLWARLMEERFAPKRAESKALRFHTQTGGSTLTAQQPDVNVVRVTLQALAAVLGGTQSLHTNGWDEALALPSERSATLALRTAGARGGAASRRSTRSAARPMSSSPTGSGAGARSDRQDRRARRRRGSDRGRIRQRRSTAPRSPASADRGGAKAVVGSTGGYGPASRLRGSTSGSTTGSRRGGKSRSPRSGRAATPGRRRTRAAASPTPPRGRPTSSRS